MTDIKLEELPKSKEFMKHAKIAKGLTNKTGLEHGFIFCKPNNEIIIDKLCVGNDCSIDISEEKCNFTDDFFHTHPHQYFSEQSENDVCVAASNADKNKKSNISCVLGSKADYIKCDKVPTNKSRHLSYLTDEMKKEKAEGYQTINIEDILFDAEGTFIEFSDTTGNIEMKGTHKDIVKNIMKRHREAEEKWLSD